MAPLTELGIKQAEEVSLSPLLEGCQVIVSSPYTRALQTAAIISKNTG
ncbi:MAG: phosphoglycerate mutase family protein, partial [Eubacterium sp.]|nr:phosphoglycerate mutase family protein [Eubacterium sp.]